MEQKMLLGQAFWGSDKDGYHVLGISDSNYRDTVEKICLSIGTPDGLSEIKPFLISHREGNMVFMACCRNGKPDSSHRKTLFFHVLFGERSECDSLNISAFSLFRNGIFVSEPAADCNPVKVPALQQMTNHRPPFAWCSDDLAIVAKSPQNELIENLVGKNANRYSWATFTFNDLPQYKIFAISEFVLIPDTRVCRNVSGEVIYTPVHESETNIKNTEKMPVHHRSKLMILLLISLVLNGLLLFIILHNNQEAKSPPKGNEQTSTQGKAAVRPIPLPGPTEDEVRKKLIDSWKSQIPAEIRISDWNSEINKYPVLQNKSANPDAAEYEVFHKLKCYVEFVNKNILQTKNEEK